ncbi:MAG: hypothetical protein JWM34_3928 [Ilumatobacteraceae bacterium]|nr:hypothetical protein [Ilumatobacteraceae bacterium]
MFGGLAVWLLVSGFAMRHEYAHLGLDACPDLSRPACAVPLSIFRARYDAWAQFLPRFVMFLPGLVGVFVGGPLIARELETGTFRFAWTQGCTRTEWLTAKLVLVLAPLTAAALALSALFTWWFQPFEPLMGRMSSGQAYEVSGTVFAARTLLALGIGILVGTLLRRVVLTIVVAGAIWFAIVWVSVIYIRPSIETPVKVPADSTIITRDGWTTSEWLQAPNGAHIGIKSEQVANLYRQAQAEGVSTDKAFENYLTRHGYVHWASFQPASRFWHFQLIETAGYLVLVIVLITSAMWCVRRSAT